MNTGFGHNEKKGGNPSSEMHLMVMLKKIYDSLSGGSSSKEIEEIKDLINDVLLAIEKLDMDYKERHGRAKDVNMKSLSGGESFTVRNCYSCSVCNTGDVDITVNNVSVSPGVSLSWSNDDYGMLTYIEVNVPEEGNALLSYVITKQ